jgi:hypothetical protein
MVSEHSRTMTQIKQICADKEIRENPRYPCHPRSNQSKIENQKSKIVKQ